MNTNTTLNPLELMRTGTFTSSGDSQSYTFSEQDLAATALAYNPALHEAPLVIGHPSLDAPAYGYLASASFSNNALSGLPKDVDPAFAELVNARRFGKISTAFYAPNSPNNPVPGVYYIRHIGFLGAQPPAVKGLKNPTFADDDTFICIEFGESVPSPLGKITMTPEEIAAEKAKLDAQAAELKKQQAEIDKQKQQQDVQFAERDAELKAKEVAVKRADAEQFADKLIKEGRLLPCYKTNIIEFALHENHVDVIEFSEGDSGAKVKKTMFAWLKSFLEQQPVQVQFGEFDKGKNLSNLGTMSDEQIARKARTYHQQQSAAGNNISFSEAVDYINSNATVTA